MRGVTCTVGGATRKVSTWPSLRGSEAPVLPSFCKKCFFHQNGPGPGLLGWSSPPSLYPYFLKCSWYQWEKWSLFVQCSSLATDLK